MFEDVILLIEECINGEDRAWYTFAKEFGSMAENILGKFHALSFQDQENVIQNVFIRLLKGGLSKLQGSTKYEFFKYFKTIVINEAISYLKSERREKKYVSLNGEVNVNGEEVSEGSSLYDSFNPECHSITHFEKEVDLQKEIEEREYREKIKRVMKGFPLLDQQIFFMKIKGYKDEEIKKILKIPLGTVASKYSRIRSKIMEELGER